MLVLTRKSEEGICIGDSIRITVIDVRGNKVRLGIEAPAHVRIHRNELVALGAFDFVDHSASEEREEADIPAFCI
jgi:carbon storage regulator